jgi:hypothetical protein
MAPPSATWWTWGSRAGVAGPRLLDLYQVAFDLVTELALLASVTASALQTNRDSALIRKGNGLA